MVDTTAIITFDLTELKIFIMRGNDQEVPPSNPHGLFHRMRKYCCGKVL
jgi:hypothetical protein